MKVPILADCFDQTWADRLGTSAQAYHRETQEPLIAYYMRRHFIQLDNHKYKMDGHP